MSSAKHVPFTKESLAVGYHKHDVFLLSRTIHRDGRQELSITYGTGETTFSGTSERAHLRLSDGTDEHIAACHHFKFFCDGDDITLTYLKDLAHTKRTPHNKKSILMYAGTKDRTTWVVGGMVKDVDRPGVLIPEITPDAGDIIYFEHDDLLESVISKNLKTWKSVHPPRVPHWHFYEGAPFHIMGALSMDEGIALFFQSAVTVDILKDSNLRDEKIGEEKFVKIGAALFAKDEPTKLIWQTELPLAEMPLEQDFKNTQFSFLGVVPTPDKNARFYIASPHGDISFFEFPAEVLQDHRRRRPASLRKSASNPILEPTSKAWESGGTFNPAAVKLDGKVHLLYRAVGNDGWSRIGYASSKDGTKIDERLSRPVYTPREWYETSPAEEDLAALREESLTPEHDHALFASGGGWGGCEDPKAALIDGRIYMTYVAHNGGWPARTAITSISVDDFLHKKWKWTRSMLMSPPNVSSKSVVLLPEKIDGQFVLFHRIWPSIMIDFVPSLEFGEGKSAKNIHGKKSDPQWLTGQYAIRPRPSHWDSRKMSMGATPIKTKDGWLAIYGAIDKRDSSRYVMGAMLLDLQDPRKVIARSRKPIVYPDEWYENNGKPGVVYPGGAVDLDGMLHVYYGGGDFVSCVATIPTEEILWHLQKDRDPRFTFQKVGISAEMPSPILI